MDLNKVIKNKGKSKTNINTEIHLKIDGGNINRQRASEPFQVQLKK